MQSMWEQAFGMLDSFGPDVGEAIIEGIRTAPRGRGDVVDAWVAIGERIDAIVEASRTMH